MERGEVASSSCSTAAGWVLEWAPSYRCGGVGDLVRVAQVCIGRPVGAAQYIALIWLVASLAMVGGALGAGLEADSTVREAAYGYRPDVEPPT